MTGTVEEEILVLRDRFRSDRDPSGRGFAPLADALRRAGRLDEAAAVVHEGVGALPDFSIGHLVAAWVHRDRGDLAGARGSLREVLRLDPLNVVALRQLARLLDDGGDPAEAHRLRERAAAVDGGTGEEVDAPLLVAAPIRSAVAPVEAASPPEDLAPPPGESPAAVSDGEPTVGEAMVGEEAGAAALPPPPGGELPAADPDWFVEPWTDGEDESDQPAFPPDDVQTRTMAEVYASQGLLDRAVEVYSHLLGEDPENGELAARLEELREQRRARRAQGHEGGAGAAPTVPEAAAPEAAVPDAGAEQGDEDDEGVLLHLPSGAGDVVESPFAWTQADEEEPGDAGKDTEGDGPPLSAFFDEILSWSPTGATVDAGVTAAEAPEVQEAPEPDLLLESATEPEFLEAVSEPEVLEPATEPEGLLSPAAEHEALPAPPSHPGLEPPGEAELLPEATAEVGPEPLAEPEAEAPEEPVPAPEPAAAAPRGPAGSPGNPVAFESLAPDGVPHWVPVAQLAPEGSLPRWVPIGELAPDPDAPRTSAEPSSPGPRPVSPPPPDAPDDEFRAWLERLRL